jgi:nucleoside-diphosphate-sugar epimerase
MKTALVLGAGGFIGSHLVKRLKSEGFWVRGVDLKRPEYDETAADDFVICDLRDFERVQSVMRLEAYEVGDSFAPLAYKYSQYPYSKNIAFDEVYQLAADMGGAGYIFTGENDANVMHNSATINLNVAHVAAHRLKDKIKRIFYSSSACMYPEHNQLDPNNPNCEESSAYPANPDSEYGWEKLFSERMYLAFARNYGLEVRIARFHNIFGPYGTWKGGKEKAPAAMCRKVVETLEGGEIEVWGDGSQTRSFLYIDECVEGVLRLMRSDFEGPVNIGSEEMVTINQLAQYAIDISGKNITIKNIDGPTGVRGRNSDNKLIQEKLGWSPNYPLYNGLTETFNWINKQVNNVNAI